MYNNENNKGRIVGLDVGTNSLGCAVVDYHKEGNKTRYKLVHDFVNIFEEAVNIEGNTIRSHASEKTEHKHTRVGYWREKTRKISLIRILSDNGLWPTLSQTELKQWRYGVYPKNEAFLKWQQTFDDKNNGLKIENPYYYRNLCLTESLDMSDITNRYIVGRAIYHLNQRRGFNSKQDDKEDEDSGTVKKGISKVREEMKKAHCEYLGQYFYSLYQKGERIRGRYTDRKDCESELRAICEKQGLGEELTEQLCRTIIEQRKLKSQKGSIGFCTLESSKIRCPVSHPLFEQYRMYEFINSIRLRSSKSGEMRPLTAEERKLIVPKFLKTEDLKFKDIAKILSKHLKTKELEFNYNEDQTVACSPVTAKLSSVFVVKKTDEDAWIEEACRSYKAKANKTKFDIMNDVWHFLYFGNEFSDKDSVKSSRLEFATERLGLDDEHAKKFSEINIPKGYASLSLKAIRKILPYMKYYGMGRYHACFMAKLIDIVPIEIDKQTLLPALPEADAKEIENAFYEYDDLRKNNQTEIRSKEHYVKLFIISKYNLGENGMKQLRRLYNPSGCNLFIKHNGEKNLLGLPETRNLKNPSVMRSLHHVRACINTLLKNGEIDEDTIVRVELAREMNDKNWRGAILTHQKGNEKDRKKYIEEIKKIKNNKDYIPTETDITKYKLWEEQKHICIYTGEEIKPEDLFDENKYDLEHTIPHSLNGDSTDMNLTVCQSKYNREIKRTFLPSELPDHDKILERIAHWKEEYEKLDKQIWACKKSIKGITDKNIKDEKIKELHIKTLKRNYKKGKYLRFTMTQVPEGFSRRQGVDIGIISKYAMAYLKTVFRKVQAVKGIETSEFRKLWGLQLDDTKNRDYHCHHAIDATVIACIGAEERERLKTYYNEEEDFKLGLRATKPLPPSKPWENFAEDVLNIQNKLIVKHDIKNNMGRHTRRKMYENGNFTGKYMQGDTARSELHGATFYGKIKKDGEIKYVVRKPVSEIIKDKTNLIPKIVDETVRKIIEDAIKEHGDLASAVKDGIWMNKEKGIKINKVRVVTKFTNPICLNKMPRDLSKKEHKRGYYVENKGNNLVAIYRKTDKKGTIKTKAEFVTNIKFAEQTKKSSNHNEPIVPRVKENGFELKYVLRKGTMVLLYENSPKEIYNSSVEEWQKRLYIVTKLDATGDRLELVHHQMAVNPEAKGGKYMQNESFRPKIRIMVNQINALVQGVDFKITNIGDIVFRNKKR